MLDSFYQLSQTFLEIKSQDYRRYFIQSTPLKHRFSILVGQRGVGKTTTLVQYLLDHCQQDLQSQKILYVPTDHFLVGNATLYDIAEQFMNAGGSLLAFDEIHKYSGWSQELKSIYDTMPALTIIASGSSALEIHKGSHDLSRRAITYSIRGLSFREYLELVLNVSLPAYTLAEILSDHASFASTILKKLQEQNTKVLLQFSEYLQSGYYPYFLEVADKQVYTTLLEQNIHTTIEADLTAIYPSLTGSSVKKIKQLLAFIASAVPFTPHWRKIKNILEIGDERTLKTYFKYLEDAELIKTLIKSTHKLNRLETPEKIYLNNTNQLHAITPHDKNDGTIRETFFLNMLSSTHDVTLPQTGDFLIDQQYTFEVGGHKKSFEQIKTENHPYLACDGIEKGIGNKIPLWLFGFLY